jgi:hypothetical protein
LQGEEAGSIAEREKWRAVIFDWLDCDVSRWGAFQFYVFVSLLQVFKNPWQAIQIRGEHKPRGAQLSRGFSEEVPKKLCMILSY